MVVQPSSSRTSSSNAPMTGSEWRNMGLSQLFQCAVSPHPTQEPLSTPSTPGRGHKGRGISCGSE